MSERIVLFSVEEKTTTGLLDKATLVCVRGIYIEAVIAGTSLPFWVAFIFGSVAHHGLHQLGVICLMVRHVDWSVWQRTGLATQQHAWSQATVQIYRGVGDTTAPFCRFTHVCKDKIRQAMDEYLLPLACRFSAKSASRKWQWQDQWIRDHGEPSYFVV